VTSWADKNKAVVHAIRARDLDTADALFAELRELTRVATDPRFEADESYTLGMLRDAQGRLAEADAAFRAALELDRRLRGPRHPAVGETLHSLAIVHSRRGDHAGAVASYRAALEIFRETRPGHVPSVLASIGFELCGAGDLDGALEAYAASETAALSDPNIPRHDLARALAGAGEVLRRSKRFVPAFAKFAACTRLSTSVMWPKLAHQMGAAWLGLGIVSRYALVHGAQEAAFAFWYATIVGDAATVAKARAQLDEMPERVHASGDPSRLRVVFADDAGNVHVASCADGLRHVVSDDAFDVGDAVELEDGVLVAADDPALDPLVVIIGDAELAIADLPRDEALAACRAALATLDEAWASSRSSSALIALAEISGDVRDIVRAALACARLAEDARPSRDPDVTAGLKLLAAWVDGRATVVERTRARAKLDRYNGARDVPLGAWATYCALGVGASRAASAWYHAHGASGAAERALPRRDRARVAAEVRLHLECPRPDAVALAMVDDSFTLA
jgi:tetratricopeptide (TPR) repeat protein